MTKFEAVRELILISHKMRTTETGVRKSITACRAIGLSDQDTGRVIALITEVGIDTVREWYPKAMKTLKTEEVANARNN